MVSVPAFYPLDRVTPSAPMCDNQKYSQTLPNGPPLWAGLWGTCLMGVCPCMSCGCSGWCSGVWQSRRQVGGQRGRSQAPQVRARQGADRGSFPAPWFCKCVISKNSTGVLLSPNGKWAPAVESLLRWASVKQHGAALPLQNLSSGPKKLIPTWFSVVFILRRSRSEEMQLGFEIGFYTVLALCLVGLLCGLAPGSQGRPRKRAISQIFPKHGEPGARCALVDFEIEYWAKYTLGPVRGGYAVVWAGPCYQQKLYLKIIWWHRAWGCGYMKLIKQFGKISNSNALLRDSDCQLTSWESNWARNLDLAY